MSEHDDPVSCKFPISVSLVFHANRSPDTLLHGEALVMHFLRYASNAGSFVSAWIAISFLAACEFFARLYRRELKCIVGYGWI